MDTCSLYSGTLYSGKNNLKTFQWADIAADLKWTAPLLCSLLEKCVEANRARVRSLNSNVVIGLVGGILLRNANERVNIVQRLISILLTAAHAPKQVILFVYWYTDYTYYNIAISKITETGPVSVTRSSNKCH